jgi:hypothetical protein
LVAVDDGGQRYLAAYFPVPDTSPEVTDPIDARSSP